MQYVLLKIRQVLAYGRKEFQGSALANWHAISNQVWLWNIALTLSMLPIVFALTFLFGQLVGKNLSNYLLAYTAIPGGIFIFQVFLFWWGNNYPLNVYSTTSRRGSKRTIALHLLIISNCTMLWLLSLFIGAAGGIHFLFPVTVALPFYFFRSEIHRHAWLTKGLWVMAIMGQFASSLWLLPQIGAWWPLPEVVTQIGRSIILILTAIIGLVWLIYFWWQWGLSRRAFEWWEKISNIGVETNQPESAKKTQILINRFTLLSIAYIIVFYPVSHGINTIRLYIGGYEKLFISTVLYSIPIPIGLLILGGFIYVRLKHNKLLMPGGVLYSYWPITLSMIWTLIILIPSVLFQPEISCHLYFIPLSFISLIFAYMMKATGINRLSPAIPMVAMIGVAIQYEYIGGLMPVPDYLIKPSYYMVLSSLTTLILLFAFYLLSEFSKSELGLQLAHQQSEKLLLNILPAEVSLELKTHGYTVPREYPLTTVLFTDFVGFTRIAEKMTATELVRELDQCFSYFDNVAQKYGLEKLKTIGDAYMAAGGIPIENFTHPIDCALAALEIQAFMNQMKEIKEQQALPYWELRLGMHTGPLVAGVVGEKKFAYDVWGDTVNTASRMESSGSPGAINISRELFDQLKFLFACEFRGKVYAKNKGEIEMYFLRGLKPKFSVKGEGRVPNAEFKSIYEKIRTGAKLIEKKNQKTR